jgi:hypothetical protein
LAAANAACDWASAVATLSALAADRVASKAVCVAAKQTGYTPDAAATTESETAAQAASDAEAADTAAQQAAETVAKSADMTLNVGTVRYNISTGAMTFNGQSLTGESEADLAAQCRAMLSAK